MASLGVLVSLGVVLYWLAMTAGYLADDFFQLAAIEGRFGPHADPFSNYTFAFEDAEVIAAHRRRGSLPWWTTDDWHFGMLRPLSSLTLELDYRLFPRRPLLSHLHSYLWFAAMLVAADRLLHRLFGPWRAHVSNSAAPRWVPIVALVAFFFDESNAHALMWIANRCAFISAVFGLLAIDAHLAWRAEAPGTTGHDRGRWFEAGWWLLAFAAGEYALCAAAYVLAYELVGHDGPWRPRARAVVPAVTATLVFVALYLVYGASSMGLAEYADPFVETGRFLEELGYKLPRLLGELWASVPADGRSLARRSSEHEWLAERLGGEGLEVLGDDWRHAALSSLALLVAAAAIVTTLWGTPLAVRRTATWCALGACLGVIPLSSTMPQARLLVLPGFGAAVVIALCAETAVARLRAWPARRGRALLCAGLAVALLGLDVVTEWIVGRRAVLRIHEVQASLDTMWLARMPVDEIDSRRHVLVLSQPEFITTVHGFGISNLYFDDPPATWHTLGFGVRPYLLTRPSDDRLVLSAIGRGMFVARDERSFRRRARAFEPGDQVDVGIFSASIGELHPNGGIARVAFDFRVPLDDPRWLVLRADEGGLTPVDLPPVGGQMIVPLAKIPQHDDDTD